MGGFPTKLQPGSFPRADARAPANAAAANVTTQESTSSTTYADLATVGPVVTLVTGTSVIVWLSAIGMKSTTGYTSHLSVEVSGASRIAANDTARAGGISSLASGPYTIAGVCILNGLTPGRNTFTMKYRVDGGPANNFSVRSIAVLAI